MAKKNKLKSKINLRNRGRQVNAEVLEKLKDLLNIDVFRRDHLIEYLHIIQDNFGFLQDRYLVALAEITNIPLSEVYEVATFYAHFNVVKDSDIKAPEATIRVCESLTCEMFKSNDILKKLLSINNKSLN